MASNRAKRNSEEQRRRRELSKMIMALSELLPKEHQKKNSQHDILIAAYNFIKELTSNSSNHSGNVVGSAESGTIEKLSADVRRLQAYIADLEQRCFRYAKLIEMLDIMKITPRTIKSAAEQLLREKTPCAAATEVDFSSSAENASNGTVSTPAASKIGNVVIIAPRLGGGRRKKPATGFTCRFAHRDILPKPLPSELKLVTQPVNLGFSLISADGGLANCTAAPPIQKSTLTVSGKCTGLVLPVTIGQAEEQRRFSQPAPGEGLGTNPGPTSVLGPDSFEESLDNDTSAEGSPKATTEVCDASMMTDRPAVEMQDSASQTDVSPSTVPLPSVDQSTSPFSAVFHDQMTGGGNVPAGRKRCGGPTPQAAHDSVQNYGKAGIVSEKLSRKATFSLLSVSDLIDEPNSCAGAGSSSSSGVAAPLADFASTFDPSDGVTVEIGSSSMPPMLDKMPSRFPTHSTIDSRPQQHSAAGTYACRGLPPTASNPSEQQTDVHLPALGAALSQTPRSDPQFEWSSGGQFGLGRPQLQQDFASCPRPQSQSTARRSYAPLRQQPVLKPSSSSSAAISRKRTANQVSVNFSVDFLRSASEYETTVYDGGPGFGAASNLDVGLVPEPGRGPAAKPGRGQIWLQDIVDSGFGIGMVADQGGQSSSSAGTDWLKFQECAASAKMSRTTSNAPVTGSPHNRGLDHPKDGAGGYRYAPPPREVNLSRSIFDCTSNQTGNGPPSSSLVSGYYTDGHSRTNAVSEPVPWMTASSSTISFFPSNDCFQFSRPAPNAFDAGSITEQGTIGSVHGGPPSMAAPRVMQQQTDRGQKFQIASMFPEESGNDQPLPPLHGSCVTAPSTLWFGFSEGFPDFSNNSSVAVAHQNLASTESVCQSSYPDFPPYNDL